MQARKIEGETRRKLKAAVFDANSYQSGPDLGNLAANVERLQRAGLQAWVSEAVVLEWAEHLASDWREASVKSNQARKRLRRARLKAPDSPYKSEEEVIADFEQQIHQIEGLQILPLTAENALQGLKDQILLRGPAKRKDGTDPSSGVKTGASDSAWLRDVLDKAGGAEPVLFITEDKDVTRALDSWGYSNIVTRARSQLRESLFEVSLDADAVTSIVLNFFRERLPNPQAYSSQFDEDSWLDLGTIASLEDAFDEAAEDLDKVSVHDADIVSLTDLAGIHDLVSTEDPLDPKDVFEENSEAHISLGKVIEQWASVHALFLARGRARVSGVDHEGNTYERLVDRNGLLISARFELEIAGGQVTSFRPEVDSVVHYRPNQYSDPEDGLIALIDALSSLPGLDDVGAIFNRAHEISDRIRLRGSTEYLEIEANHHDQWSFSLSIGDDCVTVSCEHDVGAHVWDGRESFDYYPPYYLLVDGIVTPERNPEWAVAAWLLRRIS
ncbi:hypothetical protein GCM10009559_81920 [Pseudonocardia zijingensis]|uniref:DUF4935 domain-containing protein n=1 Tax=Pseudonocardia zijingensis TaxID=153376 RepID=A0ABN1NKW0_9PSEU